jgi:hypothetical protein
MSAHPISLHCFAYGEHLDELAQRSLGYRLLAPARPAPWSGEVEALARRLQATPFPDHWPPTDLFCSVLLADGSRLVAVARYGLADHTPSARRGGLECIGAVAPGNLSVAHALTLYSWLRQRRAAVSDLHALGGEAALSEILATTSRQATTVDPVPVLPIRLWQEGALLFAAAAPSDPDHRIGMLEQGAGDKWQWLPLVGSDFPLQAFAQRGPLIAWTPHLAGVALKVDRHSSKEADRPARSLQRASLLVVSALVLLALLVAVNLWATLHASRQPNSSPSPDAATARNDGTAPADADKSASQAAARQARQAFADALYAVLAERGVQFEWDALRDPLLARYERAAREHPDLRLPEGDAKGRVAVGAAALFAERSAGRIEEAIKKALAKRGFDPELVSVACQRVREQLIEEARKTD